MSGYGRHFASMYTGSMVGMGSDVFAVWGYVIAHVRDGAVELNPRLLAAVIGTTPAAISEAIGKLCNPDPESRNPDEEGRRLVHESAHLYRVVSAEKYLELMIAMNKRIGNAKRQAKFRESRSVTPRNAPSRRVSHSDSDSDSDSDSEAKAEAGEKIESPRARRGKPKVGYPEDLVVAIDLPAEFHWSQERLDSERAQFKDHHLARESKFSDWQAAWRTWCRNAQKFERPSSSRIAVTRSAFEDQMERVKRAEERERTGT